MTSIKKLDCLVVLARDMGCITNKQLERIAKEIYDVRKADYRIYKK